MDIDINVPGASGAEEQKRAGKISAFFRGGSGTARRRIVLLDEIRGLCVFLMVIYHMLYTAGEFFNFETFSVLLEITSPLEPLFAALFIVICGASSRLSHNNFLRGIKLVGVAALITVVTAFILPAIGFEGAEIRFGVIHMLAACILIYAVLAKPLNKVPAQIGILVSLILYVFTRFIDTGIFGIPYVDAMNIHLPDSLYDCGWLFPLGFHNASFYSADYFPLLPWIFVFMAGVFGGGWLIRTKLPEAVYRTHSRPLAFLGRHALIVYILHQPVIFAIFWPLSLLLR